jgi:hypothetical protein
MPAELFCETHAAGHVIGSARPNQSLGFNRGSEKENWIRTFPWFTLLASWAASFGLQHRGDASLLWVDGGGPVSDLAQAAAYGDVQRQVLTVLLGTLGVWLLLRAKGRGLRRAGGGAWLFIAYYGWAAVSYFWADDPAIVLRRRSSWR